MTNLPTVTTPKAVQTTTAWIQASFVDGELVVGWVNCVMWHPGAPFKLLILPYNDNREKPPFDLRMQLSAVEKYARRWAPGHAMSFIFDDRADFNDAFVDPPQRIEGIVGARLIVVPDVPKALPVTTNLQLPESHVAPLQIPESTGSKRLSE